jgi:16S rRNA C967 or C1407 C5-methylase (RsmB/RsmF family)
VLRLADDFRPGKHPLHDRGAFYVLDFSSVFSAAAMLAIERTPVRVLDLCSAPGGKAIFAARAFRPELLACNETIRKRTGSLISNLDRCGIQNALVWGADPSVWARKYPGMFDLVIVDAPCSGQSLIAKGTDSPDAFLPQMIDMCVGRQRRIMGNAMRCVAPGGHLLYATCTYAYKENEKVIAWAMAQDPEMRAVEVPSHHEFQSTYVDFPCYRLFPQRGLGAGAYVALLRREGDLALPDLDYAEMPAQWRTGQPAVRQENKPLQREVRPFREPRRRPR